MGDLRKEFGEAENLLRQGAVRQAVQQVGLVLEQFLRELYQEVLPKLPAAEASQLSAAQEEIGRGKSADQLTLGELVALFYKAKLINAIEKHLGISLRTLANEAMVKEWVDLRNRASHAHPDKMIALHEAEALLANVKKLLVEAGVLQPPPKKEKLPAWWEVAKPHRDIREGQLALSRFAAKLDEVVAGRADPEYRDPNEFFTRTHVTLGLRNLLSSALQRLLGKGGDGVLHIETAFGGGKTHSLIALYHFFGGNFDYSQFSWARPLLEEMGVEEVPRAKILSFVGTEADPLGPTPWGLFGKACGKYELVREHDERRQAPGKGVLRELLGEEPTLILVDEVAEFLCRLVEPKVLDQGNPAAARAYQSQVFTFIQELTEIAAELPRCLLVITTTTSTAYGEEGERVQENLRQIAGRMQRLLEPVGSADIYEVIRRRLFEDLGDREIHEAVAEKFFELYRSPGLDLPEEAKEPAYKDKIVRAYPFHPELIDVLYNLWGSFPNFQRTRGVLRLLALVVQDAWRKRAPIPLIRPGDVPLDNREVRQIFISCIGGKYESVVAHDIAGGREVARGLDKEMPEELRSLRLAEGLAVTIFLHSFSGAQKPERGATAARLRLGVIAPGIQPTAIGDALHKLEDAQQGLHYLHRVGGRYYFSTEITLARALYEAEENVEEDTVIAGICKFLEKKVGSETGIVAHKIWPKAPEEVPDRRDGYVLVVLSPDYPAAQEKTREFLRTLFSRAGESFRTYPGSILALVPDGEKFSALRRQMRRLLALREVERTRLRELSQEDRERLKRESLSAETAVAEEIPRVWRNLVLWRGQEEPEWMAIEPYARPDLTLASVVVEHLKARDRYAESIPPERLLELVPVDEPRRYREIWEAFLRTPRMPILPERAVRNAVKEAVKQGLLALEVEGEIIFRRDFPDASLDEGFLLPPDLVPKKEAEGVGAEGKVLGAPAAAEGVSMAGAAPAPPSLRPKTYRLRAKVPWERFSDIFRGVIRPLQEKAEEMELVIEIEAKSAAGLPKEVLDQRVRETLRQINAQILEEREE